MPDAGFVFASYATLVAVYPIAWLADWLDRRGERRVRWQRFVVQVEAELRRA